MIRYINLGILALVGSLLISNSAQSAEVTMRIRGTTQAFSGNLVSFDGSVYVLETQLFGEMSFELSKYECVSGACEPPKKDAAIADTSAGDPPPSGLTRDRQIELFEGFRNWNNFQTFLEWRKSNPN